MIFEILSHLGLFFISRMEGAPGLLPLYIFFSAHTSEEEAFLFIAIQSIVRAQTSSEC